MEEFLTKPIVATGEFALRVFVLLEIEMVMIYW